MDKAGPELSVGTFGPDHALSRKDIAAIYEEAKGILERIGVTCHSEKVMARIRKHEGVKVSADKGKIFLTGRLVDRFVKATRQANLKLAKSENRERKFKLYGPYVCLNYLDFETGIIRPANTADLIASLRLLESLGIPGDTAPVVLADVPRTVQNLSMFKTCLEHSEHIGGRVMSVASKEEADWIIKLGKASGRKPPYIDFEVSISPLTLDDKPFEIYLDYLDQGKAEYISLFPGTIPLAGVTAPLPFPGMLVQSIAESFAGYIIRDLVHALPGKITYESRLDIGPGMLFDMKTGTHLVQLMPESFSLDHIFTLFRSEILGCSCPQAFPLWSMSKSCDVYYGFSLGLSVLWAALKGTREFSWVGQLGGDEIFSPEKAILDCEAVRYAEKFMSGIRMEPNLGKIGKIIEEVGPGGNFLTHPSTVENCRDLFSSEIFKNKTLAQWRADGAKSVRDEVKERVIKKINEFSFQLEKEKKKKLNEIFEEAIKNLH